MKFAVLGPLEVHDDVGTVVPLSSSKQRQLLGVLLSRRNTRVHTDVLMDALWFGHPPRSARTNLQLYVHRLRRLLDESRIVHHESAYELVAGPDDVDDVAFERLAADGRHALDAGDPARAAALLRDALALWRAPDAYADLEHVDAVQVEAARLDELRHLTLEHRIDADLNLGQHDQVIPELTALIAAYPLRQRWHAQLMLALYRSGRTADALEAYRRARATMIDEVGLEPGPELRELERAILHEDPALDTVPPTRAGGGPVLEAHLSLPAPNPAFTGRHDEVDEVIGALTKTTGEAPAPPVVAINGPGGIGKSTFALHVAHAVAEHFPDGQLYLNLCGATPGLDPLEPHATVSRVLRTFGFEERDIPADTDAAATLFRSALAGRRVLLVLDDARTAAHVRPLLPAPPSGSALLVTSRRVLAAIEGATHVALDTLSTDEAVILLSRLAGTDRVAAEPEAALDIVRLCGHLPLAVRIAGARVRSRPDWPLSAMRDRLDDAHGRLDELQLDDLAVRTTCDVAYQALPDSAAELFAHLGLVDLRDVTVHTAQALVDRPSALVRRDLDLLVETQLLTATQGERYALHDLVRLYARERATQTIGADRRVAAARRVAHHYLATARNATRTGVSWSTYRETIGPAPAELQNPGAPLRDGAAAAAWIRAEVNNIAAAVHHAAGLPGDGPSVLAGLAVALAHPLRTQDRWADIVGLGERALEVAPPDADPAWVACIHHGVSDSLFMLHRFPEARWHGRESLASARRAGDRHAEAQALRLLGFVCGHAGDLDGAVHHYQQALELHQDLGDPTGEALTRTSLGVAYHNAGRIDDAIAAHQQALDVGRGSHLRGIALFRLGDAYREGNLLELALDHLEQAVTIFGSGGFSIDEALAGWLCGDVLYALDRTEEARRRWQGSLELLSDMGAISPDEAKYILQAPAPPMPDTLRRGRPGSTPVAHIAPV